MIGLLGKICGQAFAAAKRLPAPPTNQIFIGKDEVFALRQTLEFLDQQHTLSHQGYYSTHSGWAGKTLKNLLDRADPPPKRWYIRHNITGLYLGSCHTTGDGIWTDKKHAESWSTEQLAIVDGLNYHPMQRLKRSAIKIVEE